MKNKLVLALLVVATPVVALAQTAPTIAMPSSITGHFDTMATVIVAGAAAVALGAFSLKVIPMGLRFLGRVWGAVTGR